MATITALDYRKRPHWTPITAPAGDEEALNIPVTVVLHEPPIGQPNFVQDQIVAIYAQQQEHYRQVTQVNGPASYQLGAVPND